MSEGVITPRGANYRGAKLRSLPRLGVPILASPYAAALNPLSPSGCEALDADRTARTVPGPPRPCLGHCAPYRRSPVGSGGGGGALWPGVLDAPRSTAWRAAHRRAGAAFLPRLRRRSSLRLGLPRRTPTRPRPHPTCRGRQCRPHRPAPAPALQLHRCRLAGPRLPRWRSGERGSRSGTVRAGSSWTLRTANGSTHG